MHIACSVWTKLSKIQVLLFGCKIRKNSLFEADVFCTHGRAPHPSVSRGIAIFMAMKFSALISLLNTTVAIAVVSFIYCHNCMYHPVC